MITDACMSIVSETEMKVRDIKFDSFIADLNKKLIAEDEAMQKMLGQIAKQAETKIKTPEEVAAEEAERERKHQEAMQKGIIDAVTKNIKADLEK